MATTFAPVPLALHPNMPDPSHPHAHENHSGRGGSHEYGFVANPVVLNTPSRSQEAFPRQDMHDPTYLPTPQSAAPLAQQQQHPFLQKHTEDYKYASPVPTPHWQPQPVAGPSTYRRTPNLHSPMSVNGSEDAGRGLPVEHASPARAPLRGRMTALGEQVMMDGMQRMQVDEGDGRVGVEEPLGERQYTEMKCLGDGSFGTVWLCDWHSPVRSSTMLSAMQCGAGARPEWAGKRLVALKRMKRVWEGGWSQASKLGEIYSLSRIPAHPAIIPLYDAFISPKSRELYFVFECMEGNLYQLTKSRRGRPLAAGLIASCFHQISTGLHHIHRHGYFHRDMKPENLLVTTTGLADYLTTAALNQINSSPDGRLPDELPIGPDGREQPQYEKDVMVIVKLADFGLARATDSKPPYTEYVSTRWYRAPEVLLRSTEYGPPVDMWALGTIFAEMLNLKPLFPGSSEIDQVWHITKIMGDPTTDYGVDERGRTIGGGAWVSGIKLAKNVGFSFPKAKPANFRALFNESVPQSLVDCIADLLRYNPRYRMTSAECIEHPYFRETLPHLQQTPPLPRIPFSQGQPQPGAIPPPVAELSAPPRAIPPSHSHHESRPAFANGDMRTLPPPVGTPDTNNSYRVNFPGPYDNRYETSALVNQLRELDLPTEDLHSYGHRPAPSPRGQQGRYELDEDPSATSVIQRTRQWAEETGRRESNAHSTMYDGSNFEGSEAAASNASFSQFNLSSQAGLPPMRSNHKVANYVQAQQQIQVYEDGTPRQPLNAPSSLSVQAMPGKPPASVPSKKKKWGMSSIFGGGEKSTSTLAPVEEVRYTGSSSGLKRTQSGNDTSQRGLTMTQAPEPTSVAATPTSLDPKQAKKEAEKAKRDAEKLKRETAARMQKERARAVMMKRQNLIEQQPAGHDMIEYSSGYGSTQSARHQGDPAQRAGERGGIYASPSGTHLPAASSRSLREVAQMPATQSMSSIQSRHSEAGQSHRSGYSGGTHQSQSQPQLPMARLDEMPGRHKARRRDVDDDHSMSSFDHQSLKSRSVLTVGTVDSDPGPRRRHGDLTDPKLAHAYSKDPLLNRKAHGSVSSFHHGILSSKLASMSNPSLESQLARDFAAQAKVASGSTSSLGQLPNASGIFGQGPGQGSAPTSPYGHPKGVAVAHGVGMGRAAGHAGHNGQGVVLPSIRNWEDGNGHGDQQGINPMFRVPGQIHQDAQGGATLPPFSDIARVADSHHHLR